MLHILGIVLVLTLVASNVGHAQGFRSVGVCIALSWSSTPLWIGIEASTETSWSVLGAALFVTPDGKTLFTAHLDVPLQEDSTAYARMTGGFYYFEPGQPLPYPLVGAGLSYVANPINPLMIGFAGEFIYPLAFPMPMFSISGGWSP